MTPNGDAKVTEKLICRFENDMGNLVTFDLSTKKVSKYELWYTPYNQKA